MTPNQIIVKIEITLTKEWKLEDNFKKKKSTKITGISMFIQKSGYVFVWHCSAMADYCDLPTTRHIKKELSFPSIYIVVHYI